ncbi:MAG: DUF4388 domain-containing protein [Acidimicrobiia bacterium]
MALQGTLDTFALPDVLRLLATTGKTGRLDLRGDRGTGTVWLAEGAVAEVSAPRRTEGTPDAEALFELLRFEAGEFTFEADVPAPEGERAEVEEILRESGEMLDRWREVAVVVPSLASLVRLRPELEHDEVRVDRSRWATLAAVGAGSTVGRLGEALSLSELAVSTAVKDLVDAGLAEITSVPDTPLDPGPVAPPGPDGSTALPLPPPAPTDLDGPAAPPVPPPPPQGTDAGGLVTPVAGGLPDLPPPPGAPGIDAPTPAADPAPAEGAVEQEVPAPPAVGVPDDAPVAPVVGLSPAAADALATIQGTDPDVPAAPPAPGAATASADEGRNKLLRFLSSVKS